MIIDNVPVNVSTTKRDRNVRITVSTPINEDVNISADREVVLVDIATGNTVDIGNRERYTISRNLSVIMNDTITLPAQYGGLTITAGQLAAILEAFTDKYATQDHYPPTPAPVPAP